MRRKPVTADRSVADPAARAPRAPPGSYRATRSVYSSYTATVNAAFEWLFPNTSAGQRTSALRSIENKTWKARLVVPVPGHARSEPCCPCRPCPVRAPSSGSQRSPAVTAVSRRGPDPRQRRIAVNLTVLPKLAVPIAVRRAGLPGNATITTMDRDWMRERLEKFRAVCEECAHSNQDGYGGDPAFGRACTAWSQRREPCSRRSTRTSPASTSTRWPGSMRASRPRIGVWGCSPTWTTSRHDSDRRRRPCRPTSFTRGSGMPLDVLGRGRSRRRRRAGGQEHHSPHPAEDRVPAGR